MKYSSLLVLLALVQPVHAQTGFSESNAASIVRHLSVDIGPRPMGSPAEQEAMQFAVRNFKEAGCDTAYIMNMKYTDRANTTSGIAVGIKRGKSSRMIVIGGHIDSAGPEIPGADDDGSGSACVMEIAHVLGKQDLQSTLVFCCFGGEEQGLEGSKYFASYFPDLDRVDLMLQVDMANGLGVIDIDPDTHGASAPAWLVRAAVQEFCNLGYEHLRYPTHFFSSNYALAEGSGSDHQPFLDRGIPAIDFTTDVSKPIHTPRDNFENFDPAGLKRSGDLVLKLVERFDGGQPTHQLEHYWLYVLGATPIFVPIWGVWIFTGIALALATLAFVAVRRRRELPDTAGRIRWSGLKIFLLSIIIAACGWLSSDLIALVKGVRHPWLAALDWYYGLAALATILAAWIALRLARRLKLARDPYKFFARSSIILTMFLVALGFLNIKLAIEPATALALISLAMLLRNPILKVLCIALSPWWFLRLVFSEWDSLIFRALGSPFGPGAQGWLLSSAVSVLFFSIYILPFLYAVAAVMRDAPALKPVADIVRSRWVLVIAGALSGILGTSLLSIPAFNSLWYRDVRIDETYDFIKHSKNLTLQSAEYLSGLRINHGNADTLIDSRTTFLKIPAGDDFDTTWLSVGEHEEKAESGDTTQYNVQLTLSAKLRPYTVSLVYSTGGTEAWNFDTPFKFQSDGKTKTIRWYSFPDTALTVPIKFSIVGNDSVKEGIEVTFARLAEPVRVEGESMYVIPRTRYVGSWVYKR